MDATSHNLGLAEVSRDMSYACLGWSFLSPSEVYIAFPLLILLSTLPHSSLFLSPYPQKANDPPSLRYPRNVFLSIGLPQTAIELNFRMKWLIQMMGIFKTIKVNMIKTKTPQSLFWSTHPISENNQCYQNRLGKYPVFLHHFFF